MVYINNISLFMRGLRGQNKYCRSKQLCRFPDITAYPSLTCKYLSKSSVSVSRTCVYNPCRIIYFTCCFCKLKLRNHLAISIKQ